MREKGYASTTCNITIRSFNSFLTWLHENEHTPRLRIKQLKEEKRTPPDVPMESLKRLINHKPKGRAEKRIWALGLLMVDTGCRIKELLTLKRPDVDLDNCLISVIGKGNKQRLVPISLEARGILVRHLKIHNSEYVFCSRDGQKLSYGNARRDFSLLCGRIKIPSITFHKLRHNYALNFIRNGGDVFSLKRILGHSALTTTMIYVNSNTEDLKLAHKKTSILSRMR
jgi:integrase/recombinase XerD